MPMKRRDALAASTCLLAAPAWVHAQSTAPTTSADAWPTRGPIKLVAPFPPGGLVDVVSRLIAPHLSKALDQSVVVENRAGAGALIGTEFVAKQPADGYTLLASHASAHVYAPATRRTMPFDPVADFTHVGMLVEAPVAIVVRAASPFKTLDEYVSAARAKPVRYGTSGIGSTGHLMGELLKSEARAPQHDHVPYQGSAPAMQDLMSGQIDSVFDPITGNVAALKGGSLRSLAVTTPQRLRALPDIPTFTELGLGKLTGSVWLGLSGPKGMPSAIVQRLSSLIPEVLAKPDVLERLEEVQTLPRKPTLLGDDFVKLVRSQIDTWRAVARASNVEVIG
jgi:tripartite-type tricarboxylate transporter receptor subunit TctC